MKKIENKGFMKYIIIIFCIFTLVGCQKEDPYADTVYTREQSEPKHIAKIATNKDNACWYSFISLSYSRIDLEKPNSIDNIDSSKINSITFNGYNICDDSDELYYVPVLDENDNVIGKSEATRIHYAIGEKERDDVNIINVFLNDSKFNRHIKIEDLDEVELSYFSKDLIVELYNEAFDMEPRSLGDYWQNVIVEMQGYKSENVDVTVGAFINWGYIDGVNLQFAATGSTPITLSDEQIAEINVSITNELTSTQNNQVESIPYSDEVITLELINDALASVLIKDSE